MPSSVRARGSGRAPPVTPMSERQQMALLMQMTSGSSSPARSPSGSTTNSRHRDRNERGETPLHLAAIKGDLEQVNKLLAHRSDPNVTDFAGWTPLHEACNHGWYDVAARLVASGASVNARGLDDDTPLHDASSNGHIRLVKLLVERGADIHAKNKRGKTPLDVAAPGVQQYLLNPNLPVTESTANPRVQPRVRDDKKTPQSDTSKKPTSPPATSMETKPSQSTTEDVYEFKSVKESASTAATSTTDSTKGGDSSESAAEGAETGTSSGDTKTNTEEVGGAKRSYEEGAGEEGDDESRRKKRKDGESKEKSGGTPVRNVGQAKTANKPPATPKSLTPKPALDRKSPVPSPKPPTSTASTTEATEDDAKPDLKVPPLKIVIPQESRAEQESARNGKSAQRHNQALPYVVSSGDGEGGEEGKEEKKEGSGGGAEDQKSAGHHQRVLRSSHRGGPSSGSAAADRSSNNSSPLLQQRSNSPSPNSSPAAPSTAQEGTSQSTSGQTNQSNTQKQEKTEQQEKSSNESESSNSTPASVPTTSTTAPVELHPRKRKMRPNKETPAAPTPHETPETPAVSEVHPHEQPITNCYQLYLNIRKQIERRRKGLFPVQPKPPQGFKDYLMNRCTYVLAGTAPTVPNITSPASLAPQMKDIFSEQEKERYRLRMQHVIEKEKLVLSVEQEILRVHGRAARALANQSLPFSVCTVLRDEEVYNIITPEQEEKNSQRSRYNGRLFLSWLQDVDDKWEKIKEAMLLRHHNEAESLHAVQKMDWEWKLKELNLCEFKATPQIDDLHVPMVHVSDDFDLLPA